MSQLQQLQVASTIVAMKRAMKRHAAAVADDRYDDDAQDGAIEEHGLRTHRTNRAKKLRPEARHVQRGRLADVDGGAYRQNVTHAGYTRPIISRNPIYVDSDGDLHSGHSASSEDESELTPMFTDPYATIQIEKLLRPLTSAAELPVHPSYSLAYKSIALYEMLMEAEETLRQERANLSKAKAMLARCRRDADWVPCGLFDTGDGDGLLAGEHTTSEGAEDQMSAVVGSVTFDHPAGDDSGSQQNGVDVVMGDSEVRRPAENGFRANSVFNEMAGQELSGNLTALTESAHTNRNTPEHLDASPTFEPRDDSTAANIAPETESGTIATNQHAMTTRARARSPVPSTSAQLSPSPSDSLSAEPTSVHPWFVAPGTSHPAADLALPPLAFQETRQLLLFYVQKQEQIVRSCETLFAGLAKAERLRRSVYESCKSEAHMIPLGGGGGGSRGDVRPSGVNAVRTDMSDGEDWVDNEALGLAPGEVLEKGKDEVEDFEEETANARMARGGPQVPTRRGGRRRVVG